MKTSTSKNEDVPMPPGTEAIFDITCNDVVMGRGSGTQNHCGNVTYRKLVYLNKELYATSSKFDKLKISKAIVAAIRKFGGRFLQSEGDTGHFDIGDKRAWDKTSQALREGQTEVRARLAEEAQNAPNGASKVAEYQQVISEQTFLAYACKVLQSLYDPDSGSSTSCGPNCPHAKRRARLNREEYMAFQHAVQREHSGRNVFDVQPPIQPQNPFMPPHQNFTHVNHNGVAHLNAMNNYYAYVSPEPYSSGRPPVNMDGSIPDLPQVIPAESSNTWQFPQRLSFHQPQVVYEPQRHPHAEEDKNRSSEGGSSTDDAVDYGQKTDLNDQYSIASFDTESLRKLLTDDVDMDSVAVSKQLEEMIRRKSHGLIRIDAVEAFEDLVFEEDSAGCMKMEFPLPQVANASDRHVSGLTDRGESLMEMSLLTIDDRGSVPALKAIDEKSESGDKRPSRVSFALDTVSTMTLLMDIGSMSDLYDHCENEPPQDVKIGKSSSLLGRQMGLPLRPSAAKREEFRIPDVIPTKSSEDSRRQRISTLTLSEASVLQSDIEFNELVKNGPAPTSDISLKADSMSFANMSFSNMSLMTVLDDSEKFDDDEHDFTHD
eukprot:CCRYP_014741-RA/>CCRYP_014741-RA protein AED:0.05 eAED:0.05 QI:417/1/1/1/0.5/0.33/3/852/600